MPEAANSSSHSGTLESTPQPLDLLRREELAQLLKVSCRTLDRWHVMHCGPPRVRIAGTVFYLRSSVISWLARREEKAVRGRGR
jgi:predicted DNA-binding transcriptional regulator AlpA